jgi:hypothetical protein
MNTSKEHTSRFETTGPQQRHTIASATASFDRPVDVYPLAQMSRRLGHFVVVLP